MSDRASFLRAIRDEPDDIALRLVFADWLEEQGDPLHEFIRVQVALEPKGVDPDHARIDLLHERLRPDYWDTIRYPLHARERELLHANRQSWLGEADEIDKDEYLYRHPVRFKHGLPHHAVLRSPSFLKHAATLLRCCPSLHKLVLMEVGYQGALLQDCEALSHFRSLEIADWISVGAARWLAGNPHLRSLRSLTFWLGGYYQKSACRALVEGLPGLKRIELLQLHGGLGAGRDAKKLDKRADELAATLKEARDGLEVLIVRPYRQTFPLKDVVHTHIYAGRLPTGQLGLASLGGDIGLALFDPAGNFLGEEDHPLPASLADDGYATTDQTAVAAYLKERFGFEPGLIRIREFRSVSGLTVRLHGSVGMAFLENPDALPPHSTAEDRREAPAHLYDWMEKGNFIISQGGDALWADQRGYVHST